MPTDFRSTSVGSTSLTTPSFQGSPIVLPRTSSPHKAVEPHNDQLFAQWAELCQRFDTLSLDELITKAESVLAKESRNGPCISETTSECHSSHQTNRARKDQWSLKSSMLSEGRTENQNLRQDSHNLQSNDINAFSLEESANKIPLVFSQETPARGTSFKEDFYNDQFGDYLGYSGSNGHTTMFEAFHGTLSTKKKKNKLISAFSASVQTEEYLIGAETPTNYKPMALVIIPSNTDESLSSAQIHSFPGIPKSNVVWGKRNDKPKPTKVSIDEYRAMQRRAIALKRNLVPTGSSRLEKEEEARKERIRKKMEALGLADSRGGTTSK
ncbi:MAG: hypothetical protein M1834_002570 [Cirrosporium novae-zelandiae]|nr:MAG: hypothetical protein M1834_002570 [Cirrosporium novae-zelandiae]